MAVPYHKRTHTCGQLRAADENQQVVLAGWVNNYRDHGGMTFIDLRDRDNVTQIKFNPETDPEAHALARTLRSEDVVAVSGVVIQRHDNVNPSVNHSAEVPSHFNISSATPSTFNKTSLFQNRRIR